VRLIATACLAEVLSLVGLFTFAALLPDFISEWSLTNTQAGWISGITLGTYALTVSLIGAATDRIDARAIYVAGSALGAVALAAFSLFAHGFWSALILRAIAGVALAAGYMPGLRLLVDRYKGPKQSRAVALYTSCFSLGTATSYFVAGQVGGLIGWRGTFGVAAVAAALAGVLVWLGLPPITPEPPRRGESALDMRPVFRNSRALAFILGYFAHSYELFGFRAWVVAYLAYSATRQPGGAGWPDPALVATIAALVAMGCSILGNELAERYGRRRVVVCFMLSSGVSSLAIGFLPDLPYWAVAAAVLIYSGLIQLDSASLTAGAVQAAEPGRRGATLGVHSVSGFLGGAISPLVTGLALDATGGGASALSWGTGFIAMGAVCLISPFAFRLGRSA
jgi:MFS family permease